MNSPTPASIVDHILSLSPHRSYRVTEAIEIALRHLCPQLSPIAIAERASALAQRVCVAFAERTERFPRDEFAFPFRLGSAQDQFVSVLRVNKGPNSRRADSWNVINQQISRLSDVELEALVFLICKAFNLSSISYSGHINARDAGVDIFAISEEVAAPLSIGPVRVVFQSKAVRSIDDKTLRAFADQVVDLRIGTGPAMGYLPKWFVGQTVSGMPLIPFFVTNGAFTTNAVDVAKRRQIQLRDRDWLTSCVMLRHDIAFHDHCFQEATFAESIETEIRRRAHREPIRR